MSSTSPSFDDRFVDLLIQRSTSGLSEKEQLEFEGLARQPENAAEAERYDLTIAALDIALDSPEPEMMPRQVQDRLLLAAGDFFGNEKKSADFLGTAESDNKVELSERSKANRFTWREAVAWTAAAACLIWMLSGLSPVALQLKEQMQVTEQERDKAQEGMRTVQEDLQIVKKELQESNQVAQETRESLDELQEKSQGWESDLEKARESLAAMAPKTPEELLRQFQARKPADLVKLAWDPVSDEDASGEVYWSDELQEGYMVFKDLDINDPKIQQYQLWIFDTVKTQEHPVNGGVFDISAGSVVVPINTEILVDKAVQFAITKEKPGGVVVSKREDIPLLAAIDDLP